MQIRGVGDDLVLRDGRQALPFVPEKTRALADLQLIQHRLIRHRPPADREIDWHECGAAIVAVNFAMQDARIEREMGQRLEMKFASLKRSVVRR